MSYVQRILQPGEQLRYQARLHWVLYLPGLIVLLGSLAVLIVALSVETAGTFWLAIAAVIAVIGGIMVFRAWFHRWITEIAVTNRRVIYKTGFISRETKEMQMDKVESVEVRQSILGRILDYGDVTVRGTGKGEFTRIQTIAAPLDMRNQITGV